MNRSTVKKGKKEAITHVLNLGVKGVSEIRKGIRIDSD